MRLLTPAEAKKEVLIEDYLAFLGHLPDSKKSNSRNLFYKSPLPGRNEKTASFKVDRRQNLWFDHGAGVGGSINDLIMMYHSCPLPEALKRATDFLSFHRPTLSAIEQPATGMGQPGGSNTAKLSGEEEKIRVISADPIHSPALLHYLDNRKIPLELAQLHCREVRYELYGKQYYAIGFANDAGGYELRNPYFKASSSPKGPTFIDNGERLVAVFEGFFNFLSFLTLHSYQPQAPGNFLVLNSLSLFEKSCPVMEKHGTIHLYLDRDAAGMKRIQQALKSGPQYVDRSTLYQEFKDLNQWLIQHIHRIKREAQAINRAKELSPNRQQKQVNQNKAGGHRP